MQKCWPTEIGTVPASMGMAKKNIEMDPCSTNSGFQFSASIGSTLQFCISKLIHFHPVSPKKIIDSMADFPPIVFASKSGTSFRSAGTGFAHA